MYVTGLAEGGWLLEQGHAIECRINAEDPFKNFRPGPGRVIGYLAPGGPHVRMDSHLYPDYLVRCCNLLLQSPAATFCCMLGTSLLQMHVVKPGTSCVKRCSIGGLTASETALHVQVPPNYDSLLGKLIVWGEDRTQAIARMDRALNELVISGVPTTTIYHTMILQIEDFVNGNVDTGFIPKHQAELSEPPPPREVSLI